VYILLQFNGQLTAERIKECRELKGLSRDKTIVALNEKYSFSISLDSLKNYESAEEYSTRKNKVGGMKIETMFFLATLFEVSVDYLLGISDEMSIVPNEKVACKYTGLNSKALKRIAANPYKHILGKMFVSDNFEEIVSGCNKLEQNDVIFGVGGLKKSVEKTIKTEAIETKPITSTEINDVTRYKLSKGAVEELFNEFDYRKQEESNNG